MTVVIEEMLHMSLTSNVKQAIFGPPDLMRNAKALTFPAYLVGHVPEFPINLAKLSLDQLKTFLKIESPNEFTEGGPEKGEAVEYYTIGALYKEIENCVIANYPGPYQSNRPQLTPGRDFYSQNTINTVFYNRAHEPQFPNADDSGGPVHVVDLDSALKAMNQVVEQGEGHKGGDHLTPEGEPICTDTGGYPIDWNNPNPLDFDDPNKKELAHFDKFLKMYCQGLAYQQKFTNLGLDFESYFVHNFPDNPRTEMFGEHIFYAGHPDLVGVSNLINALYTYLFLMVETCYHQDGNIQYEVFMFGVHKTMIWALSSLCNEISGMQFELGGTTYSGAPTFEYYDFKPSSSPKDQLADLVNALDKLYNDDPHKYKDFSWVLDYVKDFPDVSLDHQVHTNPLLTPVDAD
jgi:hypothetical protein